MENQFDSTLLSHVVMRFRNGVEPRRTQTLSVSKMRSPPWEILVALITRLPSINGIHSHSTPVMKPTVVFSITIAAISLSYVVLAVPALPKVGAVPACHAACRVLICTDARNLFWALTRRLVPFSFDWAIDRSLTVSQTLRFAGKTDSFLEPSHVEQHFGGNEVCRSSMF